MTGAPRCPLCHSAEAVPIVYGVVDERLKEQANAGNVHLGSGTVTGQDPEWHCKRCGYEWMDADGVA